MASCKRAAESCRPAYKVETQMYVANAVKASVLVVSDRCNAVAWSLEIAKVTKKRSTYELYVRRRSRRKSRCCRDSPRSDSQQGNWMREQGDGMIWDGGALR